jgi:hypothetical protein
VVDGGEQSVSYKLRAPYTGMMKIADKYKLN